MVSKFSDVAVENWNEDKLGFKDYAEGVIAPMENMSKKDTPFTIGIFGSWGSGKTSFMQIMQKLLAEYLFSWDYVLENDRESLLRFLRDDCDIDWTEYAEISKSDDGKTIHISYDKNSAEIMINKKKEKATLKISEEHLFSIDAPLVEKNWNKKVILEELKKEFETKGVPLSENATIRKGKYNKWEITNGEKIYIVKKEKGKLKIYRDSRTYDLKVKNENGKLNIYESRGYKTIVFKSWEYGNEDKPWIPFMIKVVSELFEKEIDRKELIKNIFLFSTDVVLQTYSQGRISTGGILDLFKRSRKNSPFKEWSDEDVKIAIERVTNIEKFKEAIEKKAKESPNGKIIIFIDDLDRIPEKIVDFLNSLKTFLDIRGCIFVLGCDYEILKNALKKKHNEEIYDDYFDKIVQTEFYIPKISEQAIKEYLRFLTEWSDEDIEDCTQLVIDSIGGNPRKIKRVVNATMLIKSVFEKRLATFLEAFERPEPRTKSARSGDGKEAELEEPMSLRSEITKIFTPAEVFDLLFEKKVLFKLVCMREQWSAFYEDILSDVKKQQDLISLQDSDLTTDMSELLGNAKEIDTTKLFSTTKEQGDKFKKNLENFSIFLNDSPRFQGPEDLKTYLTLLEISSPEAGISMKYEGAEKLPINLFNRYMLFERINKGKVEEGIIEKKINQMDWEGNPGSYYFFIQVISAFGYELILRKSAVTAKELLDKTKDTYADKIRASTDIGAIGWLLRSVRGIDKTEARKLLNQTNSKTYIDKIRASTDIGAIGWLLRSVSEINRDTAIKLLKETKDTYVKRIRASTDTGAIGWLLNSVRWTIDKDTAGELLQETKDTYAKKIIDSTDTGAIGRLLNSVRGIDDKKAKELLNQTKDTYVKRIIASTDTGAIGRLLNSMRGIDDKKAEELLNQTKDTYAKKIIDSTDTGAIGWLLNSVDSIHYKKAEELLNQTKDAYADKIRASTDTEAIRGMLDSVREIDEDTAKWLEKETGR